MAYRVYKYACRRPVAGESEAIEQMRLRVRLWNALVEVERKLQSQPPGLMGCDLTGSTRGGWRSSAQTDSARGWRSRA